MKNDDQMYKSVLSRYDAYQEKKKKRNQKLKKTAYIGSMLCLLGIVIFSTYHMIPALHSIPSEIITEVSSTSDNTHFSDNTESPPKTDETEICLPPDTSDVTVSEISTEYMESDNVQESTKIDENRSASENDISEFPHNDNVDLPIEHTVPPVDTTESPFDQNDADHIDALPADSKTDDYVEQEDLQSNYFDWTLGSLYQTFPEIMLDKAYCCQNQIIENSKIDTVVNVTEITGNNGIKADVVIYSILNIDINNEIAIQFTGRDDYIIYGSK